MASSSFLTADKTQEHRAAVEMPRQIPFGDDKPKSNRSRSASPLTQRLHEFIDGAVEVFVGSALFVDLGDRVHDRGVVLAAELTADLG